MSALKKVQAGQKLKVPAAAWNAFIDAAEAEQARQRDQPGEGKRQLHQVRKGVRKGVRNLLC